MKKFSYTWVDFSGRRGKGNIEATNREAAYKKLRQYNITILKLYENNTISNWLAMSKKCQQNVHRRSRFYRQGALLLKAGMPISDVMALLTDEAAGIKDRLAGGETLSGAMRSQKELFGKQEIAMIEAGEYGGSLEWVFSRLAEDFASMERFQKGFQQSMLYPLILLSISLVALLFIIFYILPVIFTIFRDLAIDLPLPARILMYISDISTDKAVGLIMVLIVIGFAGYYSWQSEAVGAYIDNFILRLPILGNLWLLMDLSRFLGTLSMLLAGGIVIDRAVANAATGCSNRYLKGIFTELANRLAKGNSFYSSIEDNFFPLAIKKLVAAGEASGELAAMLDYGSQYCREEGESRLKTIEIMAEPMLIIVLGVTTGFIVLSIVLPMLDIMIGFF